MQGSQIFAVKTTAWHNIPNITGGGDRINVDISQSNSGLIYIITHWGSPLSYLAQMEDRKEEAATLNALLWS